VCDQSHLRVSAFGDVCVVHFVDPELVGEPSTRAAAELYRLADQGDCRKLLLSFEGVSRVSSEMFGKLIMLNRRMTQKGGKLRVCLIIPEIRALMEMTRLDKVFDVRETESEAVAAFA
jgi:anti-anti-sigma factor